ncbi:MAG TPA: helix-turn-helix transcriptional regulator, partial [Mycobacterium sp.]
DRDRPPAAGPLDPACRHEAVKHAERRAAELAATGMTNRDIAAALFISPKTVEHNLGRVYRKLGIRNRAELGRRIGRT